MHKLITSLSLSVRLLTTGLLPFFYLLIVNFLIGQNVMIMVKIKMASIGRRYATSNWYDDMMKKWKWRMCLLQWLCSISKFRIWNQKCQPWLPSPCFTPMLVSFTSFSPPSIGSGEMPTCPSRLWMAHELGPPADLRPGAPEAQKQEAIIPRWVKDPYYHDI